MSDIDMSYIDELREQTYVSVRNSVLDAAKRGEDPNVLLGEYLGRIGLTFEPLALNRLSKDSDPTVAAFAAEIAKGLRYVLNGLLQRLA
jgi:hypothetical protein